MNGTSSHSRPAKRRGVALITRVALSAAMLAGCATTSENDSAGSTSAAGPVLPVQSNPINNASQVDSLTIESVLVENNVDASGKAVPDHLEIALTNDAKADLAGFEVYYTLTDPKTHDTESYYAELPKSFSIVAGATRVAHFDNTGAEDHFAVNAYSLYYSDTNALDVTVEVSAVDAATQTASVRKDAGGEETAD